MKTRDEGAGFIHYYADPNSTDYDHSVSQYVVLGTYGRCDQAGFEVPTDFWHITDAAWRRHQFADGAWSYKFKSGSQADQQERTSMTAAGVASLFITQEYLHLSSEANGNVSDPAIEAGFQHLSEKLSDDFQGNVLNQEMGRRQTSPVISTALRPASMGGLERIGVAGGYKYFGKCNWYHAGRRLPGTQSGSLRQVEGSIRPIRLIALLFLRVAAARF